MDIVLIIPIKMETTMLDHKPQQGRRGMVSGYPGVVPSWLRKTSLKMSVARMLVSALVFAAMALPVLAQTSSSPSTAPQTATAPSTLQPSTEPQQQSIPAAVIPTATAAPPEYRVGEGDVLGITVYNMPELDRTVVVGSEGTLVLSYLPQPLAATGKTTGQIGEEVALELKQLQVLIDPQVSVAVVQVESKPVVVGGSVRNPQVLQEVRPLTVQQALMLAGGPESGSGNSVLVTRSISNGEMVSYDLRLSKVLSGTDPKSNIPVKPGDTIQVLPDQRVFVAGDVKSPGAFPLGRGQKLTVSKLMALTGGWRADAKPAKAVIVREGSNGQRQTVPVDLPKIMDRKELDVALEPNDLLYVPDSTGKRVGLAVVKGVGGAMMLGVGYLIIRQ
jgi:polysaccharide biosynthesis/export protein